MFRHFAVLSGMKVVCRIVDAYVMGGWSRVTHMFCVMVTGDPCAVKIGVGWWVCARKVCVVVCFVCGGVFRCVRVLSKLVSGGGCVNGMFVWCVRVFRCVCGGTWSSRGVCL